MPAAVQNHALSAQYAMQLLTAESACNGEPAKDRTRTLAEGYVRSGDGASVLPPSTSIVDGTGGLHAQPAQACHQAGDRGALSHSSRLWSAMMRRCVHSDDFSNK